MGAPVRSWCFTINNPIDDQLPGTWDNIKFCKWQKEVGASGTPHLQGVVLFDKPIRLAGFFHRLSLHMTYAALKKMCPTAHWEPKKGTWPQAIAYCSKEETRVAGPWTIGDTPQPGARTDLAGMRGLAESRKRLRDMDNEELAQVNRNNKVFFALRAQFPPSENAAKREVVLYVGKPGIGKTTQARSGLDLGVDLWMLPVGKDVWFDGYDGHETVLMDDFVGQFALSQLLRLLHSYVEQVPVKGGFTWWNPKKIIITSNMHPSRWYDYAKRTEHYKALCWRITKVYENLEELSEFDKQNLYDEYDLEHSHGGY